MRTAQAILMTVGVFLQAGCGERPRAPVLRDEPVYQNDREGFRFLTPTGWTQDARAAIPPGKATKERPLVDYRRAAGIRGASFRVSLIDLDPSADLAAYLTGPSYGAKSWRQAGTSEEVAAGNVPGVCYTFRTGTGKAETVKEVIAVRRGERVYLFTALFAPKDTEVREELHRVVASVIWKN